jgi:predicted nucleotidyltransferase
VRENVSVNVWFRRCTSFEEEAQADRDFWLQYSPDERVTLMEEMRKEWADMTNASQPSKDQRDFLVLLRQHGVRVLVVGAHALAFHAKPRYTKDIDLFIQATADNARRIVAAIDEFGLGALGISESDLAAEHLVVQLGVPPNRIDLMTSIDGLTFEDAWQTRVEGTFGGVPVFFIGKDALIRNKAASGRAQDLADLELLRRF